MEDAIKLLTNHGVPADKAEGVAWAVASAVNDWWEREGIEYVADDMEIDLTDAQVREVLAWYRSSKEGYGELDREGIEWAIKGVLKIEED